MARRGRLWLWREWLAAAKTLRYLSEMDAVASCEGIWNGLKWSWMGEQVDEPSIVSLAEMQALDAQAELPRGLGHNCPVEAPELVWALFERTLEG